MKGNIRDTITHPALLDAFDADWYYPWSPSEWPAEDRRHPAVQRAIKEGWAEWIESQVDLEAVKQGYVFDLSRDRDGNPVYWYNGSWCRWSTSRLPGGAGSSRSRLPGGTSGKTTGHKSSSRRPGPARQAGPTKAGPTLIKIPIERESEEIAYIGRGDHFLRFVELFIRHTKQPHEGKPYRFIHWQRKAMLTIFGWIKHTKDVNRRPVRYRRHLRAWLEVPKKQGKSEIGSIVAVYLVRADYTKKARVYGTAVEKKQARIVFDEARDFVKSSPELSQDLFIHDSRTDAKISHFASGSSYEVVAADADSNDGFDAHGVVFDEIHRQKNRQLYATFERAGQARPQPLEFVTTTYGETLECIWGELHLKAKAMLEGRTLDIHAFAMIASAEPFQVVTTEAAAAGARLLPVSRLLHPIAAGEAIEFESSEGQAGVTVRLVESARRFQRFLSVEPLDGPIARYSEGTCNKDPLNPARLDHAIYRANPSLGITCELDRIRNYIRNASGPLAEAECLRFNLNILAGGGDLWLSGAAWMACGRRRIVNSRLLGRRCFGGLDLSQSNDLTAFWLAFPSWDRSEKFGSVRNPRIQLLGLVWVPGDDIARREKVEEVPYRAYAEANYFAGFGYVRICEGTTIDYSMVGKDILRLCSFFKVEAIAYDGHKSQFVVDPYLDPGGLNCIEHRQGFVSMAPPSQRFENLVKKHQIDHGNHPLLTKAVSGCVLRKSDEVGNRHPSKKRSISRIDPLIAAIMAAGWACDPPKGITSGAWSGRTGTGIW